MFSLCLKMMIDAIRNANDGHVIAYGSDPITARATELFQKHFGSDVTVRYFTPKATVLRTNSDAPEIRRLSDDVTIRYFNASQPQ